MLVALGLALAVAGGVYWLRHEPAPYVEDTGVGDLTPRHPRDRDHEGEHPREVERAERLTVRILETHPHDPTAFTQGLEYRDGVLYEGTGLNGRSTVRRVTLATGEVQSSVSLERQYFGEGIALVGDHLWQLTWQSGVAFLRRLSDFEVEREAEYEGEGWGLCYDGRRLVMSDGSSHLYFRDPETFALQGDIEITLDGRPLDQLNELECVDGLVYANVWQSDHIARIDPATGVVTGWIDTALHEGSPEGARMLEPADAEHADVLNGIAWMPDRRRFLVGGKEWPHLFEVELVPAEE
jgi:glutaminyl-peptide cyclotransferase